MSIEYLRSFRIGKKEKSTEWWDQGFAIFDFAISFIIMFLIGIYFKRPVQFLAAILPLSVLSHLMVGSMTPLTKMTIGPGFYHVKIIMLLLSFIAFFPSKKI